jgi:hypothetical protein
VARIVEDVAPRALLDDPPEVHDRDPVADLPDHAQVVADEDVRQAEPIAQADEQVHDLGADRDVERRDRLVEDEDRGLGGERAGDADALALAARQLVRIALGQRGGRADHAEQLLGAQPPGGAIGAKLVHREDLDQRRRDRARCRGAPPGARAARLVGHDLQTGRRSVGPAARRRRTAASRAMPACSRPRETSPRSATPSRRAATTVGGASGSPTPWRRSSLTGASPGRPWLLDAPPRGGGRR